MMLEGLTGITKSSYTGDDLISRQESAKDTNVLTKDLISRQDVYHILEKAMIDRPLDSDRWVIRDIDKAIRPLPSADRPTGEWVDDCTCSICHWMHEDNNGFALITKYKFCPNCGAKMGGESDG